MVDTPNESVPTYEHALVYLNRWKVQFFEPLLGCIQQGIEARRELAQSTAAITKLKDEIAGLEARTGTAGRTAVDAEGESAERVAAANRRASEAEAAAEVRIQAMHDKEAAARDMLRDVNAELDAAEARLRGRSK